MKKFKKSLTLFLAVIICASFCTLNGNAEWTEFNAPTTTVFFSLDDSGSYAEVHITDWATETNSTDLYAETRAYVDEYEDIYGRFFDFVKVEVQMAVTLEDYSSYSNDDYDSSELSSGPYISAYLDGQWYLNTEDHYEFISFTASHDIYVSRYTRLNIDTWEPYNLITEHECIHIGVSS